MKSLVMILAAYNGLFTPGLALSAATRPLNVQAFDYACSALHADCSQLAPPIIVDINSPELMFGISFLGAFTPLTDDVVFMNEALRLAPEKRMEVLVHEVTHYIDYHTGIIMHLGDPCAAEGLAYEVSNLWALEHQRMPRWNWHEVYPGCGPQKSVI